MTSSFVFFVELVLCGDVLGLLHGLLEDLAGLVLRLVHHVVDERLVLVEEGQDDAVVDHAGPVGLERGHAPDEEETLAEPVEGDPANQEVGEELEEGEEGEDNPVGQPLGVVLLHLGLQRLDGGISRVDKPDHVTQQLRPVPKHEPEGDDGDHAVRDVQPLHPGLVLQELQSVRHLSWLVQQLLQLVLIGRHDGGHLEICFGRIQFLLK